MVDKTRVYVNHTGGPAMAKGGSGDVLTGILTAFISQGLDLFEAASWAVYFHGKAGDYAAEKMGELSVTAGDLIEHLSMALRGTDRR